MGYEDETQEINEQEKLKNMQEYLEQESTQLYEAKIKFEQGILELAEQHHKSRGTAYFLHTKNQIKKETDILSRAVNQPDGIFSDINQEYPNDPDKENERKSLITLKEKLTAFLGSLEKYTAITSRYDSGHVNETLKEEREACGKLEKNLQELNEALQDTMLYPVSDTKGFSDVYGPVIEIDGLYESMVSGSLSTTYQAPFQEMKTREQMGQDRLDGVVEEPEEAFRSPGSAGYQRYTSQPTYVDGKTAHYIDAAGDNAPTVNSKKPKLLDSDLKDAAANVRGRLSGYGYHDFGEIRYQNMGTPLFTHDPCPEDIYQGNLGDCYLMSSLAAVAAKAPEKIKEMIKLVDNGTKAVVRLYNSKDEPVFVTVDNSEYVIDCIDAEGKPQTMEAFARGASWVKLVEKAYVASGLYFSHINAKTPDQLSKIIEENGDRDYAAYNVIIGGLPQVALASLVGQETAKRLNHDNPKPTISTHTPPFVTAFPNGQKQPVKTHHSKAKTNGEYSPEENAFFDRAKKALLEGNMMTISSKAEPDMPYWLERPLEEYYEFTNGLPLNHAYSVEDVYQDEKTGVKYIVVRDPHNQGGRKYDAEGNAYYDNNKECAGISKVELSDFMHHFDYISAINLDAKTANQPAIQDAEKLKRLYGKALKDICSQLSSMVNFCTVLACPEPFRNMRTSAQSLSVKLSKKDVRGEELKAAIKDLFEKSEEYLKFCGENINLKKPMNSREANQFFAAETIRQISIAYNKNSKTGNEPKTVYTNEMHQKALTLSDPDNIVKGHALVTLQKGLKIKQEKAAKEKAGVVKKMQKKLVNAEKALRQQVEKSQKKPEDKKIQHNVVLAAATVIYFENLKNNSNKLSTTALKNKITDESVRDEILRLSERVDEALQNMKKSSDPATVNALLSTGSGKEILPAVVNAWKKRSEPFTKKQDQIQNKKETTVKMMV